MTKQTNVFQTLSFVHKKEKKKKAMKSESRNKNGIYCITNVTEFAKFWMDRSKVGQYT